MRAAVLHAARDLRIEAVADPAPGAGEVEVRIDAGGICGSDLHYYHDGGFGTVRLREPMILGHEIAGFDPHLDLAGAGCCVGHRLDAQIPHRMEHRRALLISPGSYRHSTHL